MPPIQYEERFRTPLELERSLGLWVDRIGRKAADRGRPEQMRVLGQYAVVAVEQGRGVFESLAAGHHEVEDGDVWLLLPQDATRYFPFAAWDTRWVVWNGPDNDGLERVGILSGRHLLCRGGLPIVVRAWERLHDLMPRQDRAAILERKLAVLDMLHALYLRTQAVAGAAPTQQALDLLNSPEGLTTSVAELAQRMRLSPGHFRRLFRQQTGTTPKAFQTAQRITQAKEMLAAGRTIKEAAVTLGFTDEFHFMRVFRRTTGQTAGQFTAAHRG